MKPAKVTLLIACCVALLCSCNPAKQLHRKQEAALNAVLASRPLLDRAGKQWVDLNPCINDSSTLLFIPGDTTYSRDTLIETVTDTVTQTNVVTRNITTLKIIHDTVKNYIRDDRALRIAMQENQSLHDSLNVANSRISLLQTSERQLGYTFKLFLFALMRQWWFWVWLVALAAWLFRQPLISLLSNIKR